MTVKSSNLAFFYLDALDNTDGNSKTFTFSNFAYTNSYFSDKNALITLTKMEIDDNITFAFSKFTFTEIEFESIGVLISFEQQLANVIQVDSLYVENVTVRILMFFIPFYLERIHQCQHS